MKFTWKSATGPFETGSRLFAGMYQVGGVRRALVARGKPTAYEAFILLPGIRIKETFRTHSTEAAAMSVAENAVKTWFKHVDTDSPAQ